MTRSDAKSVFSACAKHSAAAYRTPPPPHPSPVIKRTTLAHTHARPQVGNIAGSSVEDGVINKGGNVLVKRLGRIVHEGKLKTLKNLKADADKMVMGTECGIQVRLISRCLVSSPFFFLFVLLVFVVFCSMVKTSFFLCPLHVVYVWCLGECFVVFCELWMLVCGAF